VINNLQSFSLAVLQEQFWQTQLRMVRRISYQCTMFWRRVLRDICFFNGALPLSYVASYLG